MSSLALLRILVGSISCPFFRLGRGGESYKEGCNLKNLWGGELCVVTTIQNRRFTLL
jgi:hypothetical protein